MKIYIAGPFFSTEERMYLNEMIQYVKSIFENSDLFIPMEHFIPNGDVMTNDDWAKAVYQMDVNALNNSDIVIACYLGHYSDTGTAFEIGYAVAKGIQTFLYIPESIINVSIMPLQGCPILNDINRNKLNQKWKIFQ